MVNEGVVGTGLHRRTRRGRAEQELRLVRLFQGSLPSWRKKHYSKHLAASESLQDALLCLATRALHLLFQPVVRKAP